MNWTAIITFLAIITGVYFLWSWLSRSEVNPTGQEAFDPPQSKEAIPVYATMPTKPVVANEIPATDPSETIVYNTVYDIVVEAPVIPELDTADLIENIMQDIDTNQNTPLPDSTGGAYKPPTTSYSLPKPTAPAPIRVKAVSVAPAPAPYIAPKTETIAVAKEITTTAPSSGIAILDKIAWGM